MRQRLVLAPCLAVIACSSNSGNAPTAPAPSTQTTPTTSPAPPPVLPATLVVPATATFDLPNCQAKAALAAGVGLPTVTCPSFTGTLQNTGSGCAANIAGTTTTFTPSGQSIGAATWTAVGVARPGATVVYTGAEITVPSVGAFNYRTVPTWTNVVCS